VLLPHRVDEPRQSHAQYGTHDQRVPQQQYYQPNGSAYNSHTSSQHYTQQQQQYDTSRHWHAVPRPWTTQYPDNHHMSPGHSSAGSQAFPLNSAHYSHGYAASRPSAQNDNIHANYANNTSYTHGSQSTDGSAPPPGLTRAQLDQLNAEHPRTSNMSLWRREDQREGSWNGVGYVSVPRERDERRRDG
jgi:hypothetical protein